MLHERVFRSRVFVVGVIPDIIENILDIRADTPVVRSVPDQYICLIDALNMLENNTRIRPVTAAIFLPGPSQAAKDFAFGSREAGVQNGECRGFRRIRDGVALADIRIARNSYDTLHRARWSSTPRIGADALRAVGD